MINFDEKFFYETLHTKFSIDNKYHKKIFKKYLKKFTHKNILYVKVILFFIKYIMSFKLKML